MAPDPSTGNAKELFRMMIASDQQMTPKLSPPGLDSRTCEALVDATMDAVQLPGTLISDITDNTGDLVGALREMTEDRRGYGDSTADPSESPHFRYVPLECDISHFFVMLII
jgi:hypothetical protein